MRVAKAEGRLRGKQPSSTSARKPTWWRCTRPATTASPSLATCSESPARRSAGHPTRARPAAAPAASPSDTRRQSLVRGSICNGGAPAHRGDLDHPASRMRRCSTVVVISGRGHVGPQEAGEFSGHGRGDHALAVLAGRQVAEPPAEAQLGRPHPGPTLTLTLPVATPDQRQCGDVVETRPRREPLTRTFARNPSNSGQSARRRQGPAPGRLARLNPARHSRRTSELNPATTKVVRAQPRNTRDGTIARYNREPFGRQLSRWSSLTIGNTRSAE